MPTQELKPDGICNPVRNVLCHIGCRDYSQNVSGGVANPAALRIHGKTVSVKPVTSNHAYGSTLKKGSKFTEIYEYGSIKLHFDSVVTFSCKPNEAGCESQRYKGRLTAIDGNQMESYRVEGECGA